MTDSDYMKRAIALAEKGRGWTNPNPMVGAVIVKNGRIIGEGYHARCGELHAERNAITSLTESAEGATLYVTLEPCCHYGKTPPCTEAILEQKIGRVVIGSRDPNPKVSGKGARLLRDAGVVVEEDFMREECDRLNPVFFHYITTKTPYVVMKYAMTADGKIATRTGASKWVTGEAARAKVQEMRHCHMGIMAGIGTVLADDPMLNTRLEGKKSPIRIICDSRLRLPLDSQICKTADRYQTIVACGFSREPDRVPRNQSIAGKLAESADGELAQSIDGEPVQSADGELAQSMDGKLEAAARRLEQRGIQVIGVPDGHGRVDLKKLMKVLGAQGIDSILLEGGGELNDSALRCGIVKEVKAFVAPKLFGGRSAKSPVAGTGAELPEEAVLLDLEQVSLIGEDLLAEYRVRNRDAQEMECRSDGKTRNPE